MQPLLSLAVAASSFNLNCQATEHIFSIGSEELFKTINKEHVAVGFRVDLDARLWCTGECTATSRISSVDDSRIILRRQEDAAGDEVVSLNRRTGDLLERKRLFLEPGMLVTLVEGTCERSSFTGFPAKKF